MSQGIILHIQIAMTVTEAIMIPSARDNASSPFVPTGGKSASIYYGAAKGYESGVRVLLVIMRLRSTKLSKHWEIRQREMLLQRSRCRRRHRILH